METTSKKIVFEKNYFFIIGEFWNLYIIGKGQNSYFVYTFMGKLIKVFNVILQLMN